MRRVDELMNDYKISDSDSCLEETMSSEEKSRLLEMTMAKINSCRMQQQTQDTSPLQGENNGINSAAEEKGQENNMEKKSFSRKRIAVLAIAATLCLGTVFGFATGYLPVSDSLKDFLGISNDETVAGMGSQLGITQEVDGWTLNVKEVLGDSNSIYVLYDIIAPEGTALGDDQYTFRNQHIDMTKFMGGFGAGWTSDMLPDDDMTDNVKSFVLSMDCSKEMQGKTLDITFGDFAKYSPEIQDFEQLMAKDFEVQIPLEYDVTSKTVKLNEDVNIFGGTATLKSIEVSPITAIMKISGEAVKKMDEMPPDPEGEDPLDDITLKLTLTDGTVIEDFRGMSTNNNNGAFTAIMSFNEVIDIADIASIEVCGVSVDMQ